MANDTKLWNPDAAPVEDPVIALAKMAGRVEHLIDVLGDRLNTTDTCVCCGAGGDLDGPTMRALSMAISEGHKMLVNMARLDISDRSVKIQQQHNTILIMAIAAAIKDVVPGIDYIEMGRVRTALIDRIAQLENNPPAPTEAVWTQ